MNNSNNEKEIYIIIRDMSAGNESVGEMWKETKIFNEDATLKEVMEWAMFESKEFKKQEYSRKNIIITKPHKS